MKVGHTFCSNAGSVILWVFCWFIWSKAILFPDDISYLEKWRGIQNTLLDVLCIHNICFALYLFVHLLTNYVTAFNEKQKPKAICIKNDPTKQ